VLDKEFDVENRVLLADLNLKGVIRQSSNFDVKKLGLLINLRSFFRTFLINHFKFYLEFI